MSASPPQLGVRINHHGSQTLITVEGELDLSSKPLLRSRLEAVIANASGEVLLDLAAVTYIDSTNLCDILTAQSILLDQGRELRVTETSRQVARLFELCGVTDLLIEQQPEETGSSAVA